MGFSRASCVIRCLISVFRFQHDSIVMMVMMRQVRPAGKGGIFRSLGGPRGIGRRSRRVSRASDARDPSPSPRTSESLLARRCGGGLQKLPPGEPEQKQPKLICVYTQKLFFISTGNLY